MFTLADSEAGNKGEVAANPGMTNYRSGRLSTIPGVVLQSLKPAKGHLQRKLTMCTLTWSQQEACSVHHFPAAQLLEYVQVSMACRIMVGRKCMEGSILSKARYLQLSLIEVHGGKTNLQRTHSKHTARKSHRA